MSSTPSPRPKFTAGRLLYLLGHRPLAAVRQSIRQGGPWEQRKTRRGEAAMRIAATKLPPRPPPIGSAPAVHLLTGDRFWHQTAFCLWSLSRHGGITISPVIYDDGTLTPEQCRMLSQTFPGLTHVSYDEAFARVERCLPAATHPYLHDRWLHYPHIRKLISPHLDSSGPKLVIDSDLLFFRQADFLADWLASPDRPLHAIDCETSYGYPQDILDRLAGAPLAPLVNVGLAGLLSEQIDWDQVEYWTKTLIQTHGTRYVLEQALVAMLLAGRDCTVAPADDYLTCPVPPEATARQAVMHHYVADSKPWYFRHNWRAVLHA